MSMIRNLLKNTSTVPPGGFRYRQAETEIVISAPNFNELKNRVATHRRVNNIPIGTDFDAEIQDWLCKHIEDPDIHCRNQDRDAKAALAKRQRHTGVGTGWDGSHKWRELHIYALTQRPTPLQRAAWLGSFTASIQCGDCRNSWRRLQKDHKLPDNATPAEFFAWTVRMHSLVSKKLGKPELSVEDARAIWA